MKKWIALLVPFALLAAACGTSDGDAQPPAADSTPESEPSVTDAPVSTEAATDPPATDPPATEPPPETTEPPQREPMTVVSDDGDLSVTVPGAVAATTDVSIRMLDPSEFPPELAGGDNLDGVKIYELEPDGITFAEPVVVTRRLDATAFDALDLGEYDLPVVTMLNRNVEGLYGVLDDLTMKRLGDDLILSGTTTHFSQFLASNEATPIRVDRNSALSHLSIEEIRAITGDAILDEWFIDGIGEPPTDVLLPTYPATAFTELEASTEDFDPDSSANPLMLELALARYRNPPGGTDVTQPAPTIATSSVDVDEGSLTLATFTSTFDISIENLPSTWALTDGNTDQPSTVEYSIETQALFVPDALLPSPYLSTVKPMISATTFHSTLEGYLSFLRFFVTELLDLPPGAALYLALFDAGPLSGDTRFVDLRLLDVLADGTATVDLGIECFCDYSVLFLYLEVADELAMLAMEEAQTPDEVLAILDAQDGIAEVVFESTFEHFVASVTADEGSVRNDELVDLFFYDG